MQRKKLAQLLFRNETVLRPAFWIVDGGIPGLEGKGAFLAELDSYDPYTGKGTIVSPEPAKAKFIGSVELDYRDKFHQLKRPPEEKRAPFPWICPECEEENTGFDVECSLCGDDRIDGPTVEGDVCYFDPSQYIVSRPNKSS